MNKRPVLKIRDGGTGKVPVLKIAKEGQDLETTSDSEMSLNSLLFLPKIYAVVKPESFIPPGQINEQYRYIHGLGYPLMYLYLRSQEYLLGFSEYTHFNPRRYIYDLSGGGISMDNTQFLDSSGGDGNVFLILFLDSLSSKQRDYSIDSTFQSLKVHSQGQFVCNLPEFNATEWNGINWTKTDWFSFEHGLDYPPLFTPFINVFGINLARAYGESIPTDLVLNEVDEKWAESSSLEGTTYSEDVWVYVDENNYYVGCKRDNWDSSSHTFPARTIRVNYTIFNLPINEEFNLLES